MCAGNRSYRPSSRPGAPRRRPDRGARRVVDQLSNNGRHRPLGGGRSVAELTQKLFAYAKKVGISSTEIEEGAGSVYEAVLDAIVHHEAGLAE
ncbi:DUF768 domain-containing protein [Mesorhizobium sp. B2-4-13]|nr:DUF768 domain-containing protein [Mesorhizobium sp. B2-4-13]